MKPVVIAGAGPVGCVAALCLVQQGIPVILLEAGNLLQTTLRASTFHPPTLDMLADIGVTPRLVEQGLKARYFQIRDRRTDEIAEFDLELLADCTRHPYRLQVEQWKLTTYIWETLTTTYQTLADCRFGHQVRGVHQTTDGVEVLIAHGSEESLIQGSFLIGTDGANSAIRRALGIHFEGFTYPERFVVASTPFPLETLFNRLALVSYISDPKEFLVLLRAPSLWRILIPTAPDVVEDDDYLLGPWLEERLRDIAPGHEGYEIVHRTVYRVHQRVAAQYRRGRVLLAGDAAHVNNPIGGMGMNGGIHDAFNLCRRLISSVAEDRREPLDLYERQRRTVCIDSIQKTAMANKTLLEAKDPDAQLKRLELLFETAAEPEKARSYMLMTSMIQSLRDAAKIV
jgi:3-(3-hydroxy-phenyl)propionate hydroxylase